MDSKKQIRIYIIEDNNVFALMLKSDIANIFEYLPVKIELFESGEKCKQRFIEEKPQVVILDYHLNTKYPDAANGIEILDWIKKKKYDTNVIMLTNVDNIEIVSLALNHGASDYVVKTETKFKKINYSLFNLFKLIDAKREVKKYKRYIAGLLFLLAIGIAGAFLFFLKLKSLI